MFMWENKTCFQTCPLLLSSLLRDKINVLFFWLHQLNKACSKPIIFRLRHVSDRFALCVRNSLWMLNYAKMPMEVITCSWLSVGSINRVVQYGGSLLLWIRQAAGSKIERWHWFRHRFIKYDNMTSSSIIDVAQFMIPMTTLSWGKKSLVLNVLNSSPAILFV